MSSEQTLFRRASDAELIDFVDRCGVAVHALHSGRKIVGWHASLPHPDRLQASGTAWRMAVRNLLDGYKRRAEDTPA